MCLHVSVSLCLWDCAVSVLHMSVSVCVYMCSSSSYRFNSTHLWSISPTIFKQLLLWYSSDKKIQRHTVSTEKLCKTRLYKKICSWNLDEIDTWRKFEMQERWQIMWKNIFGSDLKMHHRVFHHHRFDGGQNNDQSQIREFFLNPLQIIVIRIGYKLRLSK